MSNTLDLRFDQRFSRLARGCDSSSSSLADRKGPLPLTTAVLIPSRLHNHLSAAYQLENNCLESILMKNYVLSCPEHEFGANKLFWDQAGGHQKEKKKRPGTGPCGTSLSDTFGFNSSRMRCFCLIFRSKPPSAAQVFPDLSPVKPHDK